ncbi:AAA family ATPase [Streptomyces roseirectus]|uniref:AAA family ATPase n=1 Tax=Streptomyces roseirectus TaxID=2768066 RepID=A0A7H0IPK3_9ACTN|nr:LuxR family transcriptional regulator [Streptomyces roseirectus]QNP74719.1 AAA family ATPase [Streptomyces roseirectus]
MNPLAGREHILSALGARLDATARGSGGCVVFEGPFGMGKTQLLREATLEAAERGLTAVVGRTGGADRPTPLRLLTNFLRRALPGTAGLDELTRPDGNPFWLMDRVGELVGDAARRHPLVIVLDDVHRIDDVSALALRELVRSLASSPVLWLLARRPVRPTPVAGHALDWLAGHAATRLHVGALDDEAVAELCTGVLGAKPDASVLAWAARCDGNPWLVKTVFLGLMKAGQVVVLDGTASVLTEQVPAGVRPALDKLLDGMSPGVRQLLGHGLPCPAEEVARLSGAVEEAVRVGLVRRRGAELTFTHEVIGEALRGAAPSDGGACVPSSGGRDDAMTARAVSALVGHCEDAPGVLACVLRLLVSVGRDAEVARLVPELERGLREALPAELVAPVSARGGAGTVPAVPRRGQQGSGTPERPLWTWLVRALVAVDRFDAAAAVLTAVEEAADGPDALWHGHRAELLAAAGRLDEARAEAESALRLPERSASEDAVPARLVLAHVSTQGDDLATAGDQLRLAERLVPEGPAADRTRLDWALAQFHAVGGRPATTVRTVLGAEARTSPDLLLFCEAPTAAATLVRQARQAGLGAEAGQAAALARRAAELNPGVRSLRAGAEHAEGVLRDDADALRRAADLHRLAGRGPAAGNALEDAARVEQGRGDAGRAVQLLESALDLYLECGATRDTARVQRKLRRLGVHPVRRLAADRPRSGWESLTGAELRVVRAIVDGRTNREAASVLFLSPHTVDSHLRRVFSKLDINSRVELTRHFFANEAPQVSLSSSSSV